MKRAIVTPANVPASALAELKQWLGITTSHDDAFLAVLLRASLDMCEAFIGRIPVEAVCEEILAAKGGWLELTTKPVQAITSVNGISRDGTRTPLVSEHYELDLDADGCGKIRLLRTGDAARIAVRFTAGIVPDWQSLPDALRHGLMRLAAFQHRDREGANETLHPPAAVAALWRPWRRMRLI